MKCNNKVQQATKRRNISIILDALKLSPCYLAFLITAEVPEVNMHQFWNTIKKIKDKDAYRLSNQDFVEPPSEEEMVSFIQELGYPGKCISGKSSGLDRLGPSKGQILWGMYNKKNVNFVALRWDDFMFQADNREISSARKENMPYPRFQYWGDLRAKGEGTSSVSKTQDYHIYGALILDEMINQDTKDSKAYKTYLDFSIGKATSKKARKFKKVASPSKKLSPILEEEHAEKPKRAKKPAKKSTTMPIAGVVIRDIHGVSVSKKKASTKVDRGKGKDLLSEAALLKAAQLKKTLKKRKLETHKLHASGSSDGGNSENDDSNNDDSDDVSNDYDDVNSNAGGDNEASDCEKTDSDEYEDLNLNLNDNEEEEYEEEYVCTPDNYGFSDDEEEYEELYKDVNVRLKDVKHEEEGKRDAEMTVIGRGDVSQEKSYEQVEDDAHVTLTAAQVTHKKTEGPMQSSSVSSDFANQFLNLDNALPIDNEVISMMNVKVHHEEPSTQTPPLLTIPVTVILETSTAAAPTIPPTIPSITPLPVFALKKELSQFKQADDSAQLLATIKSQIPAMVDAQLSTRLGDFIQEAFRSYTAEFKKKDQAERKRYIDLVENSMKDIIKDENVVLAKSSSQPKSTYEAAASLTKFESKKIILDKMQNSKSYRAAQEHKDLYNTLVKAYKLDKDLSESYGKTYSLKRDHEDKDKDEDPPAGSDRGLKIRKTSKDAEPSKGS
ncbi:hypothetical protein Tco_1271773 [Tanacetum coccineum]